MKIHLLSDLHLERGPYTLPSGLDFDVLVAAGDISDDPGQAIEFLRSIGKPVVMVLGNHDYWSGRLHGLLGASSDAGRVDMVDLLAEFKRLAAGTPVHVLERDSVTIKAGGKRVRFLGATLWTSYGNGNPALMEIGSKVMNDCSMIGAGSWVNASKKNAKTYQAWRKARGFRDDEPRLRFEPPVALDIHTQTVAWLERQLRRTGNWDHTVVVTHHWPSWDLLVAKHVVQEPEISLDRDYWARHTHRPDREPHDIYRLACYGSPLEKFIKRFRNEMDVWLCGHVHVPVDAGVSGVRVVANPRGYPYNDGDNSGDAGGDFDERKIIDLADGVIPALLPEIEKAAKEIGELIDELQLLATYVYDESDRYQCHIMRRTFIDRYDEIGRVSKAISDLVNSNLDAHGTSAFQRIISPVNSWPGWVDPFESATNTNTDAAVNAIKASRIFLRRLRQVHRKQKQFHRVQEYLVGKAVRKLEAQGIRAHVDSSGRRFIDGNMFLHVDDANGRTRDELMAIIDPKAGGNAIKLFQRRIFHLVGV